MKRITTFALVMVALFIVSIGRQARADEPAYISIAYQGWNCSITGQDYWVTPTNWNSGLEPSGFKWTIEIWRGEWKEIENNPGNYGYKYTLDKYLFSNTPGFLTYQFYDLRNNPACSAADKVIILCNFYLTQPGLGYSPTAPRPQAYFELDDYGAGWPGSNGVAGWYDKLGLVPDGCNWAVFIGSHNVNRPDEVDLSLVGYGSAVVPNDIPNPIEYQIPYAY